MTELTVQFGGRLATAYEPKIFVKVETNVFGNATVRAVDEAKFAAFLTSAGSEVDAANATKMLIVQHASEVMARRTKELGALKAIGPDFAEALVASAESAFSAYGAELVIRELNLNLSEETVEAIKAKSQQVATSAPPAHPPVQSVPAKSPMAAVGGIALVILLAVGGYVFKSFKSTGAKPTLHSGWDGTRPYACSGHDDVVFGGFIADLPNQTAISASEHCRLKLDGVKLTAATAIEASGNALVVVNGGSIEGTTAAVHVSGNAHVIFKGTEVKGQTAKDGNGSVTGP